MKNPLLNHPIISVAGALLLCVVAFGSGVGATSLLHLQAQNLAAAAEFPAPIPLDPSHLSAKAAVVYDPKDGRVLYEKNAHMQLPLASLTKLMTASVVLGAHTATSSVRITRADVASEGDWGFRPGDKVLVSDLIKIGLVASSNDAMAAAAASLGANYLEVLNNTADVLGFPQMEFLNPTGLDVSSTTAGAYGTAYDVARLAALFFKNYPEYFGLTTQASVSIHDGAHTLSAHATALPLAEVPGVLGAKTGYTDLAGGNLVVVFDISIGHPLVAVVLGSTENGRFDDMKTLIRAARAPAQ